MRNKKRVVVVRPSKSLHQWAESTRRVASGLHGGDVLVCAMRRGGMSLSCLDGADVRVRKGPHRGGFADYDTSTMCGACAAYWHVERAAQLLHGLDLAEQRTRVEEEFARVGRDPLDKP